MESIDGLIKRLQTDVDRAFKNPELSEGRVVLWAIELQTLINEIEWMRDEIKIESEEELE